MHNFCASAWVAGFTLIALSLARHLHSNPATTRLPTKTPCSDCFMQSCQSAATCLLITLCSCLAFPARGLWLSSKAFRHSGAYWLLGDGRRLGLQDRQGDWRASLRHNNTRW
jgi:hypothetical protein